MYLFQPLLFIWLIRLFIIYIPLCIYFNSRPLTKCIAIWYLHSTMYLFQPLTGLMIIRVRFYLHSTMYLFQPTRLWFRLSRIWIYIPLCIYFNRQKGADNERRNLIYIPLCIYFNRESGNSIHSAWAFTFHYVSIST